MNTQEVLASASAHLESLTGYVFDVLSVSRPNGPEAAANLAKVVSKLSPFLGNLIEFSTVEFLNARQEYRSFGQWKRQDPGFPDTVFVGSVTPVRDSGRSVAEARDNHYHNPPDYLVIEPEDTTSRTRNLQQTNTNGYKFQGTGSGARDKRSQHQGMEPPALQRFRRDEAAGARRSCSRSEEGRLKSFLDEPFDSVMEVCRVDFSAETASSAKASGSTAGEQSPKGIPHHVAFIGRGVDDHAHQIEGFLVEVNGLARTSVELVALPSPECRPIPHVGIAVRTVEPRLSPN